MKLSPRQLQIINLIKHGSRDKDIAVVLGISINTVKTHIKILYAKTGAGNRADIVGRAQG